ncbi:hypothetical protein PACTADRAFT_51105 [Pachysolen tannophilus NRRL Y-2460]|uniref:TLC domain-containing protein n=1 Tax=Pachysolen tannophilus NRRL Y-2460 TaxID=669874 RepID=A0A1E4TR25_PACTA|nr:hypothetical protein PACTADRAFT_51105 [Pachysolen tannophilus NRRL Y-2460]
MEYLEAFRLKYQYDDPLADLRVPFVEEYFKPYLPEALGNGLNHIHEIVFVILLYHAIFVIARIVFKILWPNYKISQNLLNEFGIHVVSFIQSIIILIMLIPALQNPYLENDRVFGYTPYSGLLTSFAVGYFIWDAIISILYSAFGFFLHGLTSSIVFGIGLTPYIMYYSPIFLLFELSNPFLNLRWFGIKFPGSFSAIFQLINNIILITIFFFMRIGWGWYQVFRLALDFYQVRNDPRFNLTYSIIILVCNFILDILNVYWFYRMVLVAIRILKQMFCSKKETESKKKI